MSKTMTIVIVAAIVGVTIIGTAIARGSDFCERGRFHRIAATAGPAIDPAQLGQWLPAAEVVTRLSAQGYADVTKVEVKRGLYEAHAADRDGRRMELQINPTTGDVIGFERD